MSPSSSNSCPGIVAWVVVDHHHDHDLDDHNDDEGDDYDGDNNDECDDWHLASGLYSSQGSPEFSMRKRTPACDHLNTNCDTGQIHFCCICVCVQLDQL